MTLANFPPTFSLCFQEDFEQQIRPGEFFPQPYSASSPPASSSA